MPMKTSTRRPCERCAVVGTAKEVTGLVGEKKVGKKNRKQDRGSMHNSLNETERCHAATVAARSRRKFLNKRLSENLRLFSRRAVV